MINRVTFLSFDAYCASESFLFKVVFLTLMVFEARASLENLLVRNSRVSDALGDLRL